MDESRKGTIGEAIFGLIIIFSVVIFLLYKFGTNSGSVSDNATTTGATDADQQDASVTLQSEFDNQNQPSEIYNKYVQQIYNAQTSSTSDTNVDSIVQNYQNELEQGTQIPNQTVVLQNVSPTYDAKTYAQSFENLFQTLKAAGGTQESQTIAAQIVDKNTLIPLSDYDKENFVRTAQAYRQFANSLQQLPTPQVLSGKATDLATGAMNIAYILQQMASQDDQKIYSVWITKYTQNMFAIIALRYALEQN